MHTLTPRAPATVTANEAAWLPGPGRAGLWDNPGWGPADRCGQGPPLTSTLSAALHTNQITPAQIHTHTCKYTQICTQTHTHTHHTHKYTQIHRHCTRAYTHPYTNTRTYTQIRTQIHPSNRPEALKGPGFSRPCEGGKVSSWFGLGRGSIQLLAAVLGKVSTLNLAKTAK